jgi:hypothetical protein
MIWKAVVAGKLGLEAVIGDDARKSLVGSRRKI